MRIIVTGMVGLYPIGGVAWDYLQYVIGLARLGHDVYYHEDTWRWPYHPAEKTYIADATFSANYLRDFFARYAPELRERWHYLHLDETSFGMERARFDEAARTADIFLNVSGASMFPEQLAPGCVKVFLDTDPGYNQIMLSERFSWSENVERWCASVAAHDRHFTYAENIHGADCIIPKAGFGWKTTRMPIVLELWDKIAQSRPPAGAPWTTVMTWNAFKGKLVYQASSTRAKGANLKRSSICRGAWRDRSTWRLGTRMPRWNASPSMAGVSWMARRRRLRPSGIGTSSPARAVSFRRQNTYMSPRGAAGSVAARLVISRLDARSSCRTPGSAASFRLRMACCLCTLDEAAEALCRVETDYGNHAARARLAAAEHFDSNKVLRRLLADVIG